MSDDSSRKLIKHLLPLLRVSSWTAVEAPNVKGDDLMLALCADLLASPPSQAQAFYANPIGRLTREERLVWHRVARRRPHRLQADIPALFDRAAEHAPPTSAPHYRTFGRRLDTTLDAFDWIVTDTLFGPRFRPSYLHRLL